MELSAVHYGLFPHESEMSPEGDAGPWHQLDGEVRLCFKDAPDAFVSWGNGPPQHSVEIRDASFFSAQALRYVEMSVHPFWRELVGAPVSIVHSGSERQVVRLMGVAASTYLSTQSADGTFHSDCIRVGQADAT